MLRNLFGFGLPFAAIIACAAVPARANTVNVQWFTVSSGTPDFNGGFCCSTNTNEVQSNLGPNGLPVSNGGLTDIDAHGQLLWWTPNGTNTLATGTSIITIPSSGLDRNMFATNGGGSSDQNGLFQTAILTGTIVANAGATIKFGGDDDVFLVLNGKVVDQVGGVHSTTDDIYHITSPGTYSLELFYADRQTVAANLQFDLTNATVSAVPEPSTWAMMILGFMGVGFMAYRRKNRFEFRLG